MFTEDLDTFYIKMGIDTKLISLSKEIENNLKERFSHIDRITEYNQLKVL